MLRTITIGSTLQVQGVPVGHTSDGRLMVRDGDRVYAGLPVPRWTESATPPRLVAKLRDLQGVEAS